MTSDSPPLLYTICDNPVYGIIAGHFRDRQVLVQLKPMNYLIVAFDNEGEFLSADHVSYSASQDIHGQQQEIVKSIDRSRPIQIRQFFLPNLHLGIKQYPSALEEVLSEIDSYSPDEQKYYRQELLDWHNTNQFVLHWNNEYYLNSSGQVVAS